MGFFKKITDKIGFTIPLILLGALLPLAVWGGSALLSYSLAHLGSASIFIGALTWSNIWPVMAIATLALLVIGIIVDICRKAVSAVKKAKIKKAIKNGKDKEKSVVKSKEKGKPVRINKEFDKVAKKGYKKSITAPSSGRKMIKLDDRNKTKVYNNKDKVNIINKDIDKKKYFKKDKMVASN